MPEAMHYIFVPTQESPAVGRIILREGETAHIHVANSADTALLERFFAELSERIRYHRFFTVGVPPATYAFALPR